MVEMSVGGNYLERFNLFFCNYPFNVISVITGVNYQTVIIFGDDEVAVRFHLADRQCQNFHFS